MRPYLLELALRRAIGRYRPFDASVLVCERFKTAYFPVPKAANSSIRLALLQAMGNETQGIGDVHGVTRSMLWTSSRFFSEPRDDWFMFTVVRDPTTRARSAWRNKLIESDPIFPVLKRMGITEKIDFTEFLDVCADWPTWALNDHFMPQSLTLSQPLSHPGVKVFRFETLATDWAEIASTIKERGAETCPELPHKNSTKKPGPATMDARTRELLNRLYDIDYSRFEYAQP